jgi:hypothetical protein
MLGFTLYTVLLCGGFKFETQQRVSDGRRVVEKEPSPGLFGRLLVYFPQPSNKEPDDG